MTKPSRKKEAVLDLEIYPNYSLFAFQIVGGGKRYIEMRGEANKLSDEDRRTLGGIMRTFETFGFNSNNFDMPLILYALSGATAKMLCAMANAIIGERMSPWRTMMRYNLSKPRGFDHFDLMEPAPAVKISLKLYGGRMHSKRLQDLPIEPNTFLTDSQMDDIREYCMNDLATTIDLRNAIDDRIKLRRIMSAKYGMNFMSKSDAQMAEAIIVQDIENELGRKIPKATIPDSVTYNAPDFIQFKTAELKSVLNLINGLEFTVLGNGTVQAPQELDDVEIRMGTSTYKVGIGGLHSQESSQVIVPEDNEILADRDVTSFYPNIILMLELFPPQMGRTFLSTYTSLINQRVAAKKQAGELKKKIKELGDSAPASMIADFEYADATNEGLKVCINGTYGKLGSSFSLLYSPSSMLAVTMTGQLSLLMLIETLELHGFRVVSGNTDGFVTLVPKDKYDLYDGLCLDWELKTGFNLEETQYKGLYSRDVNNYFALTTYGEIKGKGVFTADGLKKSPAMTIVSEAVIAYCTEGIEFSETLRACDDIRKFMNVRTVNGGAMWRDQYLGRVVRWIYAPDGSRISYKKNGDKVPKSDGARVLQTLPEEIPSDIDYAQYAAECDALYKSVTGHSTLQGQLL